MPARRGRRKRTRGQVAETDDKPEQVEEEATAGELVDKLTLIGDHPAALFQLDGELSTRAAPTPPAEE